MVNGSPSGGVSARSSGGGFGMDERVPVTGTATLRGSCTAAGHGLLPRGFSQGILPGDSPGGCSQQHPRYSEPVSVFTPVAALISECLQVLQSFCVVVTEEALKTFLSHRFSDYFFPPRLMVWHKMRCATGCQNKGLQLQIRN